MKDNAVLMFGAVVGLSILGGIAIYCGDKTLSGAAVGALAGLIGGHMNGAQQEKLKV